MADPSDEPLKRMDIRVGDHLHSPGTNVSIGNQGVLNQHYHAATPPPTPWYQEPPFPPELADERTTFVALAPAEAAQRLFAVLPTSGDPTAPLPPVAPQLAPTSRLPFHRLATFVGRQAELHQLARAITTHPTVIASGMMGMGKTSLALEFAHRYGRYFAGGVYWVECAETTQVPTSIAQCGLRMGLYGEFADLDTAVQQVLRVWQAPIPRLLIFDNCDDPQILTQYGPTVGGSRMLVTARRQQWGRRLVIAVGVLPRMESIRLLQSLASQLSDTEADYLADYVGDLPLGLHLVGSYLGHYQPNVTTYLSHLDLTHHTFAGRGVQEPATEMPGRTEINLKVVITVALEQLEGDDPITVFARQILDVLCQLAPGAPVARDLLSDCLPDDLDPDDVMDACQRVMNLGFVEARDDRSVWMHRVVHAWLNTTHATASTHTQIVEAIVRHLSALNEDGLPFANPLLIPHAAWTIRVASPLQDDLMMSTLMNDLALAYTNQGRYAEAEPLYVQALQVREQLVEEHPATATSLNNLAVLYGVQGRDTEAERLYVRALAMTEHLLGEEHPDTAGSLNNLALLYSTQGRHREAEPMMKQALALRKRLLGMHPDTAMSMNNLGALYEDQGRVEEAERLYLEALSMTEQVLGAHPNTSTILNNLAELYAGQRRYAEAEPLLLQALVMNEEMLGDHPDTATSLNNLAGLYERQERYAEAGPLHRRALTLYERLLGDHLHTASSLHNLAYVYQRQGQDLEAEQLYLRALALRERLVGEHLSTVGTLRDLGALYAEQGRYRDAEGLYVRALTMTEHLLGEHPFTVLRLNNLAALYMDLGRYRDVEPLLKWALDITERLFGAHPDTAAALNNLAYLYAVQGRYGDAEPLYKQALELHERLVGEHPDTATSLNNLAALYVEQGSYGDAEPLYIRSLEMTERLLGVHLDTAVSLNNLAHLYHVQGWHEKAEPLYTQSLAIKEHLLGEHPATVTSLTNLAVLYEQQGRYAEAMPLYVRAVALRGRLLGEHPDTAGSLNNLAGLYAAQGRYEVAELLYERATRILQRFLGADHPSTQTVHTNWQTCRTVITMAVAMTHALHGYAPRQAWMEQWAREQAANPAWQALITVWHALEAGERDPVVLTDSARGLDETDVQIITLTLDLLAHPERIPALDAILARDDVAQ